MTVNKIMIIGSVASGKSTLGKKISFITGIPIFHLDMLFLKPDWYISEGEQKEKMKQLVDMDKWIIDGNYSLTMDIRMEKADTIIFLDINRWICISSYFKRYLQNRICMVDLKGGCIESFRIDIIKSIYKFKHRNRKKLLEKIKCYPNTTIYIIKKREQSEKVINDIMNLQKP